MSKVSILIFFVLIFLFGCNSKKNLIELTQLNSSYPIILYMNKEYKEIVRIKLPLKIRLQNNSYSTKEYASIKYKYHPYKKGIGNPIYVENRNKLKRVKQSKKKEIGAYKSKEYILYSRHRVDTSNSIQSQFSSYIKEMISLNQDTLTIGTIQQFKKSHRELLNILTEKDSVSINIWKDKDVTIPISW